MPFTARQRKLRNLKRKFKSKGLTKTQAKTVRAIAKKTVLDTAETKVFGFTDENQQLIHNKVSYLGNWLKCKQGTADPNNLTPALVRIGDEFYLRSINIRFWMSNKLDRPNCMYKLFLFWYDEGATLSDALCFFTQTNKMLDRVNNESISIIDSKTIFSGSNYSAIGAGTPSSKEHSYLATLKGSWKGKKIIYDEGGDSPKKRNIGTMVVAYDSYGTLQSDNIASYAYNGNISIKDV